jgi:hypothetical protein
VQGNRQQVSRLTSSLLDLPGNALPAISTLSRTGIYVVHELERLPAPRALPTIGLLSRVVDSSTAIDIYLQRLYRRIAANSSERFNRRCHEQIDARFRFHTQVVNHGSSLCSSRITLTEDIGPVDDIEQLSREVTSQSCRSHSVFRNNTILCPEQQAQPYGCNTPNFAVPSEALGELPNNTLRDALLVRRLGLARRGRASAALQLDRSHPTFTKH